MLTTIVNLAVGKLNVSVRLTDNKVSVFNSLAAAMESRARFGDTLPLQWSSKTESTTINNKQVSVVVLNGETEDRKKLLPEGASESDVMRFLLSHHETYMAIRAMIANKESRLTIVRTLRESFNSGGKTVSSEVAESMIRVMTEES